MRGQTKECTYCGTEFYGRSNQLYCSKECKQEAFYERQEQQREEEQLNTTSNTEQDVTEKQIELEMRRLELEHERKMVELENKHEQREYLEEIKALQEQITTLQKVVEKPKQEEMSKSSLSLPAKLQMDLVELFELWLEEEGTEWHTEELKRFRQEIAQLEKRMYVWCKKHAVEELEEFELLEALTASCNDAIKWIQRNKRGIFDSPSKTINSDVNLLARLQLYLDELEDESD